MPRLLPHHPPFPNRTGGKRSGKPWRGATPSSAITAMSAFPWQRNGCWTECRGYRNRQVSGTLRSPRRSLRHHRGGPLAICCSTRRASVTGPAKRLKVGRVEGIAVALEGNDTIDFQPPRPAARTSWTCSRCGLVLGGGWGASGGRPSGRYDCSCFPAPVAWTPKDVARSGSSEAVRKADHRTPR